MKCYRLPQQMAVLLFLITICSAAGATGLDSDEMIAAHLLRRAGFGPSPQDMQTVLKLGPAGYIRQQLNPNSIKDTELLSRLPARPRDPYDFQTYLQRWFIRMVYSKRQLREKMTLIWHEHFATSIDKVGLGCLMAQQEEMMRARSLGKFRDMLIQMTKDKAMLIWLDNNYNNGQAYDDKGRKIPPNENYAREFLQLFAMGVHKLRMDGTPILDNQGVPLKNYSERDVREIARAFTGWYHDYECAGKAKFYLGYHDPDDKVVLGTRVPGRAGRNGTKEIEDVVDIVMKHPSVAPFISKILIQKLSTETPSPDYVQRVATTFANSNGDIKAVVSAILNDSEFYTPAVVLSQYKEPVEQFVGALRGLEAETRGGDLIGWTFIAGQLPYYPPSVFSFYPPGGKEQLINSSLLINRDRAADVIAAGGNDTNIDAAGLIRKHGLKTADQVVDYLSDALIAGPLDTGVRAKIIAYMKGRVDEEKFRGALWLLLCSPDFQRN